jgi:hypothetical protein
MKPPRFLYLWLAMIMLVLSITGIIAAMIESPSYIQLMTLLSSLGLMAYGFTKWQEMKP